MSEGNSIEVHVKEPRGPRFAKGTQIAIGDLLCSIFYIEETDGGWKYYLLSEYDNVLSFVESELLAFTSEDAPYPKYQVGDSVFYNGQNHRIIQRDLLPCSSKKLEWFYGLATKRRPLAASISAWESEVSN